MVTQQAQALEALLLDVSHQVDELIDSKDLSIRGAARVSGLANQTMTMLLACRRDVRLSTLVAIAEANGAQVEIRICPKERVQLEP